MKTESHPPQENQKTKLSWKSKALSLVLLSLLLIIPSILIMRLTQERQKRKDDAYQNISQMWGKPQTITGFYLQVPHSKSDLRIYPQDMELSSSIQPQIRKRGIYKVPIYTNNIKIQSTFKLKPGSPSWQKVQGADLSKAKLILEIKDLSKGLDNELKVNIKGQKHETTPVLNQGMQEAAKALTEYDDEDEDYGTDYYDAATIDLPISMELLSQGLPVGTDFTLNGTEHFKVIPTAIQNSISIKGKWSDPSAIGSRLPSDPLQVVDGKFNTSWSFINRSISPASSVSIASLASEAVGVSMLITVDNYTKVERSLKYAIMIIILCFAAMFMLEVFNKKELHIIHYALAGASLVLFYILLLSISEYTGFDIAYLIAALSTIALLVWFVGGLLRSRKLGMYLGGILSVLYSYNFVLLNAKEYALLMGSIGLFMVLFVIMYFTRKLDFES